MAAGRFHQVPSFEHRCREGLTHGSNVLSLAQCRRGSRSAGPGGRRRANPCGAGQRVGPSGRPCWRWPGHARGRQSMRWMVERTCAAVRGHCLVTAAASAYLLLLSQCYASAMHSSADLPLLIETATAALIAQAVPLSLLGLITPTILHHGKGVTGRWAGLVLAVGSGGGIVGALAAGLVGLPGLGISRCYLSLAARRALAGMAAIGPHRAWRAGGVLLALLAAVAVCWCRHEPGTGCAIPLRTDRRSRHPYGVSAHRWSTANGPARGSCAG